MAMTVTLPLEVALLVVDFARFRRLDESAVAHLARLTRVGLACKAFYKVVEHALRTTRFVTLSCDPGQDFLDRDEAHTPLETLFVQTVGDVYICEKLNSMYGRDALRKLVVLGNTYGGSLLQLDRLSDALPFLECLFAAGADLSGPCTSPFLHLRELAVDFFMPLLVKTLVSPSITPNLRRLAIRDPAYHGYGRARGLIDDTLLERLDFLQLDCHPNRFNLGSRHFDGTGSTPILVCLSQGNDRHHSQAYRHGYRPPYVQLQPLCFRHDDNLVEAAISILGALACVRAGGGQKALFIPRALHPSAPSPNPAIEDLRVQLMAAVEEAKVEHVGWYHADDEARTAISEPFRRYLDRERLERRM